MKEIAFNRWIDCSHFEMDTTKLIFMYIIKSDICLFVYLAHLQICNVRPKKNKVLESQATFCKNRWASIFFFFFFVNEATFLAHLSRRLTGWAYSIPKVCGRPHFQTRISLKPVGQSWLHFMCSITWAGERLHNVFGQIGSKLWFPWQKKAPIGLIYNGENDVSTISRLFWIRSFLYLQVTRTCMKFRPDWTADYGVSCPWASENFPIGL